MSEEEGGGDALRRNTWWIRDATNPVLPPGEAGSFDDGVCMNPWVLIADGRYHLYYAGGKADGTKRICLATAPVTAPRMWTRHGPLFEVGPARSFDARWCVLPHVVQVASDRWHLYYTGRSDHGEGLSAFPGLGLAVSRDGREWTKLPGNPILAPTGRAGDPDAMGMAGGSVLRARLPDGSTEWRYYYTGCPTLGDDVFLNQQKRACLAVSRDGIAWERRGAIMLRDPDRDYENVATAGPVVQQQHDRTYRMWYSAIGTRWGYYSIGYAESEDGLHWRRGEGYGDNLQLGPLGSGWERQMVEYPAVVHDGRRTRLFYCGNGYGTSGIGTAVAAPLRATPVQGAPAVRLVAAEMTYGGVLRFPAALSAGGETLGGDERPVRWHGPDAEGTYWHEWQDGAGVAGVQYRALISHQDDGLRLRCTVINGSRRCIRDVAVGALVERRTGVGRVIVAWDEADGTPEGGAGGVAGVRLAELPAGATHTFRGQVTLVDRG